MLYYKVFFIDNYPHSSNNSKIYKIAPIFFYSCDK